MDTLQALSSEQLEKLLKETRLREQAEAALKRKGYEDLREQTISSLMAGAQTLSDSIKTFKTSVFGDLDTLYTFLREYSARHKQQEQSGFTLDSADKRYRIRFSRHAFGFFDERSMQAEKHIQDFIDVQFPNDNSTKKLVLTLLERKKGQLDIKLVQKLYSMENDFDDPNWQNGIRLLKESWQCNDTRDYVVFYIRNEHGKYEQIDLNFSSI